jgi:hypothetical protein
MKSSNLAFRMEVEPPEAACAPEAAARARVEARARERRRRLRATFDYRAIVIRDQGFRPFRVC